MNFASGNNSVYNSVIPLNDFSDCRIIKALDYFAGEEVFFEYFSSVNNSFYLLSGVSPGVFCYVFKDIV